MKLTPWLLVFVLLPFLLLSACKTVPVTGSEAGKQTSYRARSDKISSVLQWNLIGRISLDDGEEGGSGRLQWVVKADQSKINFHGAMGRGAWQLDIDPKSAALRLADGNEYFSDHVDELVQQQIGWPVPVEALQWWVRGLAAPGPVETQQLDDGGLLTSLTQFGWRIDFTRYNADSGMALPVRLDARQNDYRVKLAISHWYLPTSADG